MLLVSYGSTPIVILICILFLFISESLIGTIIDFAIFTLAFITLVNLIEIRYLKTSVMERKELFVILVKAFAIEIFHYYGDEQKPLEKKKNN